MKTLVYSTHGFDQPFLEKEAGQQELIFTAIALNETTVNLARGFDAVALFTSDIASGVVIEKLYNYGVRFVALRSVGYDHVDLERAKRLGIRVANVPGYSPNAIAEHAVALLMALNRKIVLGQRLMYENDFRLDQLIGFDLQGKTIGIVGTGKIGSVFATIMHGFGCNIVGYDIEENQNLVHKMSLTYTTLEELCKVSDVIAVHCPLNAATKHLFNKSVFAVMKKSVIFINTARGGVVKTTDLIEALENGIIGAAGLDVYEFEKNIFFYNHKDAKIHDLLFQKLRSYPNVLITGHQAFLTREALQGIAATTLANLEVWSLGGNSANEIN